MFNKEKFEMHRIEAPWSLSGTQTQIFFVCVCVPILLLDLTL